MLKVERLDNLFLRCLPWFFFRWARRRFVILVRETMVFLSGKNHRPISGGAEEARTPDLVTASHALSRLSYSPVLQADL